MTKSTIESGWITQHKEAIPWSLFVGARIVTNSGQYLILENVTVRSWPAGPLFDVSYIESGKPKRCTYNFQAFSSGLLRDIEVAKTLAGEIESMTSVYEVELKENLISNELQPRVFWAKNHRHLCMAELCRGKSGVNFDRNESEVGVDEHFWCVG